MAKKFSKAWKSSKKQAKQRKYRANAPLHVKRKFLAAHLSKELKQKYKRRSFTLRKGDNVKVMRGAFKKRSAKIAAVNLRKTKVYLEGLQRARRDGTKVNVPFNPSNLMITELNLDDKERIKALERNITKSVK